MNSNLRKKIFNNYLKKNIDIIKSTETQYKKVEKIIESIFKKIKDKKRIYVYGNGGSYADASHFVGELTATYKNKKRTPLPFFLLSSNISSLTAWSNDFDYKTYLEREVETMCKKDDMIILISTSGGNTKSKQSINLINAAKKAKKKGVFIVGFLGNKGGDLLKFCNLFYIANSNDTPHIQENHKMIFHYICEIFDKKY